MARSIPLKRIVAVVGCALLGAPALAHGALSERIAIMGDWIKAHPKDVDLRLERADLLRQDEAWDAALDDLAAAEALDAQRTAYPVLRAQVFAEAKRPKAAIGAVEAFAKAHPQHGPAWWLLGEARLATGDAASAAEAMDKATLHLDPLQPDHVLAQARAHLAADKPAMALDRIEAGIARLGSLAVLEEEAVTVEVSLGRKDAALRRIDRVIADWKARRLRTAAWEKRRAQVAGGE